MLYILLPVHNRRHLTRRFLLCLQQQTWHDYRLLLIDDGSTDGTAAMAHELLPELTLVQGDGTLWWAGSLQRGIDWLKQAPMAEDDLLLLINDDVQFAADFLQVGVKLMRGRRGHLLLARERDPAGGPCRETGVHFDRRRLEFSPASAERPVNCLSTRGLFVHWGDVLRIGDFYPRLLPHYLSDYEYTLRAATRGLQLHTCDELYLLADHDSTGLHQFRQQNRRDFLRAYFSRRSAANPLYWSAFILLVSPWRHLPRHLARLWLSALRRILLVLWRGHA